MTRMTKDSINLITAFISVSFILMLLQLSIVEHALGEKTVSSAGISNVSLNKKTFNPTDGEDIAIMFKAHPEASIRTGIYDGAGRLVRIITDSSITDDEYTAVVWDGRDEKGNVVPAEAYIYVIYSWDDKGKVSLHNPMESGGKQLVLENLQMDRETGGISYIMPKAGRLRLRMGVKDGPLHLTLLDWAPRPAGKSAEVWNRMDKSGQIDLLRNPKMSMVISAFSLSDNTILALGYNSIDYGKYKAIMPAEADFKGLDKGIYSRIFLASTKGQSLHSTHFREECHEPGFEISFPEHSSSGNKMPVLSGIVPVRIDLDKIDKQRLIENRFEIMFYIDGIFLLEEESGYVPFTYMWNTRGLSQGTHILTVNVIDYGNGDHVGSRNIKVHIRRNN